MHSDGLMKALLRAKWGYTLLHSKPPNARVMVSHSEVGPFLTAQDAFLKSAPRPPANNCGEWVSNKLETAAGKVCTRHALEAERCSRIVYA